MLTEERYAAILKLLEEKKAVSVLELTELLNSSESTIRRDLTALHRMGKLTKVHGGATSINGVYQVTEDKTSVRHNLHVEEKDRIAQCAASLVHKNDFVFLDAGTTTERMIDYLHEQDAVYVTNGIVHARKLAEKGLEAYILSGKIKAVTEAIVGTEAVHSLQRYRFSIGFFGTNGMRVGDGFSTPDIEEARVKTEAIQRCNKRYVLADPSKYNQLYSVIFADLSQAAVITTALPDKQLRSHTTVIETDLGKEQTSS